jgi:hypothetical protein
MVRLLVEVHVRRITLLNKDFVKCLISADYLFLALNLKMTSEFVLKASFFVMATRNF